MPPRPNKSAASIKPSAAIVTTTAAEPAVANTNPANATQPIWSSTVPISPSVRYKERPAPTLTTGVSDDPDHRPSQSYSGAAPLRQVQQSPNLNSGQSHQPPYAVQSVFSPQAGLQSPYLNNPPHFPQHPQQPEGGFYTSNPSPRSTTSGAYYPSDKPEPMATATATMQRPYGSSIYHTPQSNSPASVTSPQTHDHGRPLYSQPAPQMQQPMYPYSGYQTMAPVHQSPYGQPHHPPPQMNAQPMLPYQSTANSLPQVTMTSQPPTIQSSPRIKPEVSQHYAQTPQSQTGHMQRQATSVTPSSGQMQPNQPAPPPTTSNAAPGPIPATTPLVVRQDQNGVQWIAFEYSRDRVKMEYTIRCDVESVDANQLSQEFKGENCVYPRACVPKDQYKGNRLAYETDCNQVGWALAELNPCLRGKRGLIQRAVDSWRNSNQDPRLRSRRVRRQAKMNSRNKVGNMAAPVPASAGNMPPGHSGASSMGAPNSRAPGKIAPPSQPSHHHIKHDGSPTVQEAIGGNQYSNSQGLHRSGSTSQHLSSPNELRHAQTFPGYPAYPSAPNAMGSSMAPPMQGGMHAYGRPTGNASMVADDTNDAQYDSELYGNLPEAKRRKFIQFDDTQKRTRVRLKVTLDNVETSEIPDSFRKQHSVFPRAYFPMQMQPSTQSTTSNRFVDMDIEEMDDGPPMVGQTTVACPMTGSDGEVEVSQLTRFRRDRELKLNELGYRMAWTQSRVFAGRPIFLGRALDAYRSKQRALLLEDQGPDSIPAHLETRPGKRRWLERLQLTSEATVPAVSSSS